MPDTYESPSPAEDNLSVLKVPPHSVEAEQAVLGGLMQDNSEWESIADILLPDDFYRAEHRRIFQAMTKQSEGGQPIDVVTLAETLNSLNELETAGGADYLSGLAGGAWGTANIKAYAEIIRERAVLRNLIRTANAIADSGFNPKGRSAGEVLDEAEAEVLKIADDRPHGSEPKGIDSLLEESIDHLDRLAKSADGVVGLASGYTDLDKLTAGWQKSDLVVVAGRPSMGKTAFALNLVEHSVLNNPLPVLMFSLEMPSSHLTLRMLSSIGRVNQQHLRTGRLSGEEWERVTAAVQRLKGRPLYIDDTPGLSPMEMRSRVRRVIREHGKDAPEQKGIAMIVVDYLQLMHLRGTAENRVNEISEISRNMKMMAREFECPVIALSQLNRGVENRPNKRPVMADLRESGAIEQDADVIAFIYRDEVYNEETEDKGVAEIIIGKQRNGPIGTVRLSFLDTFTRFENYAPPRYDDSYTHD